MKIYYLFFFCYLFLLFSCKPSRLEQSLEFAKENRAELQKVLDFYKMNLKDSLKYKSACFLIENMPYYYCLKNEKLDIFRKEIYHIATDSSCTGEKALQILERKYGKLDVNDFEKVYDSQTIKADYLIRNIEFAFKVWKKQEWGKNINFSEFCEYILPYRISHEPLENWREIYYNRYQPILDSLLMDKKDPLSAITILYDTIIKKDWIFLQNNPMQSMGAVNLLDNRIGNCNDRSELATYVMRSLSIYGGTDCILQYPDRMEGSHTWNFVVDTSGRCVEYTLYDQRPRDSLTIQTKKGRVYRKCYGIQPGSLPFVVENIDEIPKNLNNVFIKDVSNCYFPSVSISIAANSKIANNDIVYLSVYNNKEWIPISWTKVKNKRIIFQFVEGSIVYLPMYYNKGKLDHVSDPILVNEDGSFHFIKPDYMEKQQLTLYRKYPIQPWWVWIMQRPIGGKFQGADNPCFKNATTLYTIEQELDMRWNKIKITGKHQFRYLRYISAKGGFCNMAELQFISDNDSILNGEIIGTEGSCFNEEKDTKIAVFDGNPLTYYDAKEPDNSWAGLDLGQSYFIKEINYLFRNDDNSIKSGDKYELFYWNEGKWCSLGVKIATDSVLKYDNCPGGALFFLQNLTRGKEERIFTYEDNKQIWW